MTDYEDRSKLEALAHATAILGDALELFAEANAAYLQIWKESAAAERLREFRAQLELAREDTSTRTDIDNAIEVWSLPDDPLRSELEALEST